MQGVAKMVNGAGTVIDRVGYGDANEFEGDAPAPAASVELALLRLEAGCVDGDRNDSLSLFAPDPQY